MKKILFLLVSLMFINVSYATGPNGIPILMYHEVVTSKDNIQPNDTVVTVDELNAQMAWLKSNNYCTITVSELASRMRVTTHIVDGSDVKPIQIGNGSTRPLPPPPNPCIPIVITFDDGWNNQVNALPILSKFGFRVTFNIIAGFPGNDPSYMDWPTITMLSTWYGHEISSHTMTHPAVMSLSQAKVELVDSKARIQSHVPRQKIVSLAWPDGYFSMELINYAETVAMYYDSQTIDENWCTLDGQSLEGTPSCDWHTGNRAGDDPYLMKRIFVDGRCSLTEFATHVINGHTSPCYGVQSSGLVREPITPKSTNDNNNDNSNVQRKSRDSLSNEAVKQLMINKYNIIN